MTEENKEIEIANRADNKKTKNVGQPNTISKEAGYTIAQVSLDWILSKPYITSPIAGFTNVKHAEEAVSAIDIKLSDDIIKRLEAPYFPHIKTGAF